MRNINLIVIHCSGNSATSKVRAADIRKYHVEDREWSDIGYHYVIPRDGEIEKGRDEITVGAHCKGHNVNSLGICMVGGLDGDSEHDATFTPEQWASLVHLVRKLLAKYPGSEVKGHRELGLTDCPCFDVQAWLKKVGIR